VANSPGTDARPDLSTTELNALRDGLVSLGCPADKAMEMAGQLDKRARQLAAQKGRTYDEALTHLIGLMKQGWAARERAASR